MDADKEINSLLHELSVQKTEEEIVEVAKSAMLCARAAYDTAVKEHSEYMPLPNELANSIVNLVTAACIDDLLGLNFMQFGGFREE